MIIKTTFSYFPGMFENPAAAKYYLKKNKKCYEILTIYECVQKRPMTIVSNNLFVISE